MAAGGGGWAGCGQVGEGGQGFKWLRGKVILVASVGSNDEACCLNVAPCAAPCRSCTRQRRQQATLTGPQTRHWQVRFCRGVFDKFGSKQSMRIKKEGSQWASSFPVHH